MHEIFCALCQLLAPILAFSAEEAWSHLCTSSSIHLEEFPTERHRGAEAIGTVTELLRLRTVIGQAIEKARQEKLVGNALEAAVMLKSNLDVTNKIDKEELEEFFILSDLKIEHAEEAGATVTKTSFQKCARCWRHREYVSKSRMHPDLCDRCEKVVGTTVASSK